MDSTLYCNCIGPFSVKITQACNVVTFFLNFSHEAVLISLSNNHIHVSQSDMYDISNMLSHFPMIWP